MSNRFVKPPLANHKFKKFPWYIAERVDAWDPNQSWFDISDGGQYIMGASKEDLRRLYQLLGEAIKEWER